MSGASTGRVAQELRERVLTGELRPGTRLSQSKLAEAHGVSRIPIRDALHALAAEGLVDTTGGTAVVRELSIAELQELYEMRELIEPALTRTAVPNVGLAEVTMMTDLAEEMESRTTPADWLHANARFHALVYTRADRPRMIQLTERLRRLTDRYLYLHVGVFGDTDHLHSEHRRILDAVRRGDAAAAAELTRAHLVTSHEFILRYLLENELMRSD
ncbi:MAG: GntR family transcriptional regulator [Pseudonocardia sp.]|nr:GntR family transcriptional regulator [Pseudonocardia sp.]